MTNAVCIVPIIDVVAWLDIRRQMQQNIQGLLLLSEKTVGIEDLKPNTLVRLDKVI